MPLTFNKADLLNYSDPRKVNEAVLDIFDQANPVAKPATRALMHRVALHIFIANKNKAKRDGLLPRDRLGKLIVDVSDEQDALIAATKLADALKEHVLTPAYTAHPTRPESPEVDVATTDIYNLIMLIRNEMAAEGKEGRDIAKKNQTIREKLEVLTKRGGFEVPRAADNVEEDRKVLLDLAKAELAERMIILANMKLQRDVILEVKEETARNLEIYKTIFKEFNKTKHRIIKEFCELNKITDPNQIKKVADILTPAIARQFQEVHFWSASDADGNIKVTDKTMSVAAVQHQECLDELYLEHIEKLARIFVGNEVVLAALERITKRLKGLELGEETAAAEAASSSKVEAVVGVTITSRDSAAIVTELDAIISQISSAPDITKEQQGALNDLRDELDCFGFVGAKMDIRQSSVRNEITMGQILDYLRNREVDGIGDFQGEYMDDDFRRGDFCDYLQKSAAAMALLSEDHLQEITNFAAAKAKQKKDASLQGGMDVAAAEAIYQADLKLTDVAQQEIARMIVAKTRPKVFHRYIISDNRGFDSWEEVRALEAIAINSLKLSKIVSLDYVDKSPIAVYPLCETSEDMRNLPDMIRAILANPKSVAQLNGMVNLFLGPSDTEKRSGIFALALMQLKAKETLDIIKQYNTRMLEEGSPEKVLKWEIFQAEGNDLFRGGPKPAKLTTRQGQGGQDNLDKQTYKELLRDVAGSPDDFELQIKQLEDLPPHLMELFEKTIDASINSFEEYVAQKEGSGPEKHGDNFGRFLAAISMSEALSLTNKSSRAKSKAKGVGSHADAVTIDVVKFYEDRAIGLATRFAACGMQVNVWHGMSIPMMSDELMPELFLASTVIQDIVAKSFYAILTSDPSRAEKIARINGVEIDPDMMKEVKDSAFDALANILKYLPMQDQDRKAELLRKVEGAKNGQKENPHETAAALAMELGVEFPMVRELLADAQDCRNNYGALIINTLDQYQGVDGSKRKELDSDLACLFREEMQVPEVINNLSTRTQITPQKPVNLAFRDNPGDKFQALTIQNPALIY